MSGARQVTVDAQWALHSSAPGRERPRLLACSTGEFGARNFAAAIGRFGPDAGEEPSQVSVSYLMPADGPRAGYLALAVRRRTDSAGDSLTSYFCLPYAPLAAAAVSYLALHRALDPILLPRGDGPPVRVELTAQPAATPAVDDRAMQAAALLLTNRPVCVIGADDIPMTGRLAFIDMVMALLPYGLRARMAAATWASPGNADHKFRLFFSTAPRVAEPQDHLLDWESTADGAIARDDDWAYEYLTWLRDKVSQPTAKLAELTAPVGFTHRQILPVLDEIGIIGSDPSQNYSVTRQDLLPRPAPRTERGREQTLCECVEHVRALDQNKVKADISQLKSMAGSPADDVQRGRYQQIVKEGGLLGRHEKLGRNEGRLHEQLLRVAFPVPLDYEAYCQVEDCLVQRRPHLGLLQAIERCGTSDQLATAVVSWRIWHAERRRTDRKEPAARRLARWGAGGQANAAGLIWSLGTGHVRAEHALAVRDIALDYIDSLTEGADRLLVRRALRQHRYLAHAPHAIAGRPADEQVGALGRLLRAAYPDMLDEEDVVEVLRDTMPTPALLAAVLLWLRFPASDATLARRAFVYGSMSGMDLSPSDLGQILNVLPPIDPVAGP